MRSISLFSIHRSAFCIRMNWSGRRGSNPRPTAWKAVTLPLSYSRLRALPSPPRYGEASPSVSSRSLRLLTATAGKPAGFFLASHASPRSALRRGRPANLSSLRLRGWLTAFTREKSRLSVRVPTDQIPYPTWPASVALCHASEAGLAVARLREAHRAKEDGEGRTRTFEGAGPTDLQSAAFDRFATSPMPRPHISAAAERAPAGRRLRAYV